MDTVTYGGRVLGLPAAQFVMGYFVNQDLYEEANLDAPAYGFTVEEFEDAVTSLHNPSQGVLGLDEYEFMIGWYPNTQDPNLKWFSYDGEKMNYNSAPFKEGIAFAGEMAVHLVRPRSNWPTSNHGPWELSQRGSRHALGQLWRCPARRALTLTDFVVFPAAAGDGADVIVVSATATRKRRSPSPDG